MSETRTNKELQVLQDIISSLSKFDKRTQLRIIQSIVTFLGIKSSDAVSVKSELPLYTKAVESEELRPSISSFSEREEMSPKEFILTKQPYTDVERIACLAYYLTHYRNIRHFKTIDISKLNTEAAQIKFSNTTYAVQNATNKGFLVPFTIGNKQISAIGEQFVQALPDREAAKEVLRSLRKRTRRASRPKRKTKSREKE
jgi:hypothetical protein